MAESKRPFHERALEFEDLFRIHPNIDVLVYSQGELDRQLADAVGFWKSVQQTMRRIV